MAISLAANCTAWYKMNDALGDTNVINEIGTDATMSALTTLACSVAGVSANTNTALQLYGIGHYINCGNLADGNFGASQDYTISIWVKTGGSTSLSPLSKYASGIGWYFDYLGGSNLITFYQISASGAVCVYGGAISSSVWHHIVVTRSGSILSIYVDSVFKNSDSTATNNEDISNAIDMCFGYRVAGKISYYYTGVLDDCRIFDRDLSSAEISWLYHNRQGVELLESSDLVTHMLMEADNLSGGILV